ncbi:Alpha/Beta hydrolase protein [Dichotomocladium elegans]|nr:Alpha/Beta hydrolase protein [Dichotomocladium elegans]
MKHATTDSFLHGLPGKTAVLIGLVCALYVSKGGRKFGRPLLEYATQPFGYQWDSIVKVHKDHVSGNWIVENAQERGLDWVEKSAKDADLIFMYFHGGGYRLGNSLMYTSSFLYMLERFEKAHGIKARVFTVDYRMHPEVQWPVPRKDGERAYSYLIRDLDIDPSKIIIGGDSAGGNLAATLLLKLRDDLKDKDVVALSSVARLPLPLPRAAVMISPWANMDSSAQTFITNHNVDCLPIKFGDRHGWFFSGFNNMSREEQDKLLRNPYVSPIYGRFEGVGPVLVTLGDQEIFRQDIEQLVERLKTDGVQVEVVRQPNTIHVWAIERFLAPNDKVWTEGMNRIVDWCAKRLNN